MEDSSSPTQGAKQGDLETLLDDASRFVENHNAIKANTIGADEVFALATSGSSTTCSEFHYVQIASMMASKSEFETELEFQTTHSKVHWSKLSSYEGTLDIEDQNVDLHPYFEKLQKDAHWGTFCNLITNVVLGRKLGEGAQVDIFEADVTFVWDKGLGVREGGEHVVKLMKGDCALEDLQRQWPLGVAYQGSADTLLHIHGTLVKDPATKRSKFGFVMVKRWGDLRSLIDLRMEHKNAKGPPFSLPQVKALIYWIVQNMLDLHKKSILHRDLKASNILVSQSKKYDIVSSNEYNWTFLVVADWECSLGVVGTGWWRAPEMLLQLKNKIPSSKLEFNEKVDVYSFAMTCYEIITGRLPFEGHLYCSALRNAILSGSRPELPHDLDLDIRTIITSCWNPNPSLRPRFGKLKVILANLHFFI